MTEEEVKRLFTYEHLPENLQLISRPFHNLALEIHREMMQPDPRLATKAIWKLWESKNLAVASVAQRRSH